jgi:hypothetical protein
MSSRENGPSPLLPRNIKRNITQYHNNNQHIEYNHFVKTTHFRPSSIEGIFGRTHMCFITYAYTYA